MTLENIYDDSDDIGSMADGVQAIAPTGLRVALKAATAPAHRRLHHQHRLVAMLRGELSRAEYTTLLLRLFGLHAPIDAALAAHRNSPWLAWYGTGAGESASCRLIDDLMILGMDTARIAAAPSAGGLLPRLDDPIAALGCAWVVEGASAGRQVLARHAAGIVGALYPGGATFFQPDPRQADRWAACCAALDRCEGNSVGRQAILAAAAQTFDAFETWLEAA